MRLTHRWPFLTIERGEVFIHGEAVGYFDKRGPTVLLSAGGQRMRLLRWVGWAIQEICPDAQAEVPSEDNATIGEEPEPVEDIERAALGLREARFIAIAKEADPSGGAREAVKLVTYLVERELLEVTGSVAQVAKAVAPLLDEVDDSLGQRLEDVLLDLDDVDELFAEAAQLSKIVENNDHILNR